MSKDFGFKAKVLASGLVEEERAKHKLLNTEPQRYYNWYWTYQEAGWQDWVDEAHRINDASYKRRLTAEKWCKKIFEICKTPTFGTLTFDDIRLNSTTPQQRRKAVQSFCNSTGAIYIANVDYGDTTGREHYHLLIAKSYLFKVDSDTRWCPTGKAKTKKAGWGFISLEKVKSTSNPKDLAKYISKLTNHAIKSTTKQCRIIVPRIKRYTPPKMDTEEEREAVKQYNMKLYNDICNKPKP